MEGESADRWRIELRSVGSGSGRVSRFRRSPGCSADTVKAALGRGFRPSSRNQDQQRQDRQVRLHEFDQGTPSDGRQRLAELGAERHCSGWLLIGSNWELSGEAPNDVKDHDWLRRLGDHGRTFDGTCERYPGFTTSLTRRGEVAG